MKKNLKNLFSEEVQNLLTEETLDAIETAFTEKVDLTLEAALLEQDELYATKLGTLLTTLDKDRTGKLKQLVEAIDKKNTSQLIKLVRLYERANVSDADKFKKQMVNSVSAYLDEYLVESVDKDDIAQAVKNKSAFKVLENLRQVLAVDSALINGSIQSAVVDGNNTITSLKKENTVLKKQFKLLYEENQKTEISMVLENKTSKLSEARRKFLKKALGDKSLQFIEENFDYTLRLFDKQEKTKLEVLKEDALNSRKVKPDVVPNQKVVTEKVNKDTDDHTAMYLDALKKAKGTR